MKYFDWNDLKNAKLKAEREVCFEDVLRIIEENKVLSNEQHHNKERYKNQRMFIVEINDYVYLVPYVEDETKFFMKTIIPSRKATKQYLRGGES